MFSVLFGKIKAASNIVVIVIVGILLLTAGYFYYLSKHYAQRYDDTLLQLQTERVATSIQKSTIRMLQTNAVNQNKEIKSLQLTVQDIRLTEKEIIAKYTGYSKRLYDTSLQKPGLVERHANRATRELMQQFEIETSRHLSNGNGSTDVHTGSARPGVTD